MTSEVVTALRNYFTGVTIIAAFNGIMVGVGALVLGVPLAGTIAIVTFVTRTFPSSEPGRRASSPLPSLSARRA